MRMDTCPICSWHFTDGNFESVTYPSKGRQRDQAQIPATIRFCNKCGTGAAHPTISDNTIDELYAKGEYWKKASQEIPLKIFPVPFGLAQARWKLIERSLTQSKIKILDIGAGHGYLGLVAGSGHLSLKEYHAVEPNPAMRQYLQDMWAVKQYKQNLEIVESIDQVTGSYDVVVLSHILEHVQDPSGFIQSTTALLSREGLLFVDIPNQDYLFKSDVFPHNIFFSMPSLKFLLEKEQLEIIHLEAWGRNMYESPLNTRAPIIIKLLGKLVGPSNRFLPGKFLIRFYSWYFGGNQMNTEGTWIRALCKRKQ